MLNRLLPERLFRDWVIAIGLPGRLMAFLVVCIVWALALFFATLWWNKAEAQPTPPVLAVGDGAISRFEFAPIPEIALVRGMPETVQLGIWQLDPANRWTPGDQTRASGWRSSRLTRLVDVATGQPVAMFTYDGETAELRYAGTWSGDFTGRIETVDGAVRSDPFRIRVLTPTVVYGDNATAINAARGWGAVVCSNIFSECRPQFRGGATDMAPLVIFITAGTYTAQSWYLGSRRFVYLLGNPGERPRLVRGGDLAANRYERWTIRNLLLDDAHVTIGAASKTVPNWTLISNVRQCCQNPDKSRNGIVNPNGVTVQPWRVSVFNFESLGMGDEGNGMHAMYIEGRPDSILEVTNALIAGTRGSSGIKTTMQRVSVRHSKLCVSLTCGSVSAEGLLMHTGVDVPAVSDLIVYGNEFDLWQGPTVGVPNGRAGMLTSAVFIRLRKPGMKGSDKPAYPNLSWDPPLSSNTTASSPGGGWPKGPETYVDPAFWAAVKARPITEPDHVYSFKHYLGFNHFRLLPNSRPVSAVRDDGTHAAEPISQFGYGRALRVPLAWIERSVDFLSGNTYEGFGSDPQPQTHSSEYMPEVMPGAKWPRDEAEEFPHAVELQELPAWFKL